MASWGDLIRQRPDLAEAGLGLLYQFGVGLGFLATVRHDGGPRVHPICPQVLDGGLFAFLVPSPKRVDLERDGRYALQSFPCPDNEDAFFVTGTAAPVDDPGVRDALAAQFVKERAGQDIPSPDEQQLVFRFDIDRVLLTRTTGHGDVHPHHTVWREGRD